MIKPPSLLRHYTLIYSGDPALRLPPADPPAPAGEPPPAVPSAREQALTLARETGNWLPLIGEGEAPTLFELRPLPGSAYDWWLGEIRRRDLNVGEAATLILRLALRKVTHFGSYEVKLERRDGQELATMAIIDALYAEAGAHGPAIVAELANEVTRRSERSAPPKS